MLNKKYLRSFKENGYIKLRCIDIKKLKIMRQHFAIMIEILFKKNFKGKPKKFKNNERKINFFLNEGMIKLEKKNHNNLSNLYNQIVKSTNFYNIVSDKKITSIVNSLLKRKLNYNLYVNSSSIRMDIPGITEYVYGWHQDNKSNIKNSNFIQVWMPVFSDITSSLGGLHILEQSFKYDILTTHTKVEIEKLKKKQPLRANYNVNILDKKKKFNEKIITCRLGEVVFFNKKLMHKSGINKSKNQMRYIFSSFYHDINNSKWAYKKLEHK